MTKFIKSNFKFLKVDYALNGVDDVSKLMVVLIYLVEYIYMVALTKYPSSIELRINYCLFLIEKMKNN